MDREWQRIKCSQTLSCFVYGLIGKKVVVELKGYTFIEGTLTSCDCFMDLILENVKVTRMLRRLQNKEEHLDVCHVRGKYIRMVHFESYLDVNAVIRMANRELRQEFKRRKLETKSKAYQELIASQKNYSL